jgi:hypothetical protein
MANGSGSIFLGALFRESRREQREWRCFFDDRAGDVAHGTAFSSNLPEIFFLRHVSRKNTDFSRKTRLIIQENAPDSLESSPVPGKRARSPGKPADSWEARQISRKAGRFLGSAPDFPGSRPVPGKRAGFPGEPAGSSGSGPSVRKGRGFSGKVAASPGRSPLLRGGRRFSGEGAASLGSGYLVRRSFSRR